MVGDSAGEYLTPAEAARTLHVSVKTLNRWAREGRIASIVTLGGHHRFHRAAIAAAAEAMGHGRARGEGEGAPD